MRKTFAFLIFVLSFQAYSFELFEGTTPIAISRKGFPTTLETETGRQINLSYDSRGAIKEVVFKDDDSKINFTPYKEEMNQHEVLLHNQYVASQINQVLLADKENRKLICGQISEIEVECGTKRYQKRPIVIDNRLSPGGRFEELGPATGDDGPTNRGSGAEQ